MQAFTFTFKKLLLLIFLVICFYTGTTLAADDKTQQPQEEDYTKTPYTEYGEFNQEEDEEADTRFFQHGRFFGVALGIGYEGATGNRGLLWKGGFPLLDFKLVYWFDFNFAMTMGFTNVSHNFDASITNTSDRYNVNVNQMGFDFRYYFDTKNLSAAISFANPYILMGVGAYTKKETRLADATVTSDTGVGFRGGFGFEFPLKPKKAYLTFETKAHFVSYEDTSNGGVAAAQFSDLGGMFFNFVGGLLFTW